MVEKRGTARWANAERTSIAMIADDHRVYCERHSAAAPELPVAREDGLPHGDYIADPRPWSGFAGFLPVRIYGYPPTLCAGGGHYRHAGAV